MLGSNSDKMSTKIVAIYGNQQFHFGTDTVLSVGSGQNDDINVKHAGIGECHIVLKRRGDTVKVACNNAIGFFIQNTFMHVKAVLGYAFMEQTFDLHLGRSVNPNFKPGDAVSTYYIDAPNTNIKVVITPAPVARAPAPVARVEVMAVKTPPPVPVFTAEVVEEAEVAEVAEVAEAPSETFRLDDTSEDDWVPVPSSGGGACKKRAFQESQLDG